MENKGNPLIKRKIRVAEDIKWKIRETPNKEENKSGGIH